MTGPVLLFKAKSPSVLVDWHESNTPLWEAWRAGVDLLKSDLGGRDVLRRTIGFSEGFVVSGYVETDWQADPLPGFRRDKGTDHMLPALRTKAGKAWEARLGAVTYKPNPVPGLPLIVMGGGYMGAFRVEEFSGGWFAWLGFDPYRGGDKPRELEEIDSNLWAEAKFSEYYAAKEASE